MKDSSSRLFHSALAHLTHITSYAHAPEARRTTFEMSRKFAQICPESCSWAIIDEVLLWQPTPHVAVKTSAETDIPEAVYNPEQRIVLLPTSK